MHGCEKKLGLFFIGSIISTFFVTISCKLKQAEELQGAQTYGVIGKSKVSKQEVVSLLKKYNFPAKSINKLACASNFESGWASDSYNKNKNGSLDFGLFQINQKNWLWCHPVLGKKDKKAIAVKDLRKYFSAAQIKGYEAKAKAKLAHPEVNVKCAKKIYECQGLGAWYGYKAHDDFCNIYNPSMKGNNLAKLEIAWKAGKKIASAEVLEGQESFGLTAAEEVITGSDDDVVITGPGKGSETQHCETCVPPIFENDDFIKEEDVP